MESVADGRNTPLRAVRCMTGDRARLWHWPGWGQLGYAIALGSAVTVWFVVAYGGADWFVEHIGPYRVRLHLALDLAMPLVPAMSVFYLSLNLLLWSAPFILRTRRELKGMAMALAVATFAAAICFVLLPGQDAFARPRDSALGGWAGIDHFARLLALSHNYLPSLHVAFTTIAVLAYGTHANRRQRAMLWSWGLAIIASTLLTHQHYIADVASGFLLGMLIFRTIYKPVAETVQPAAAVQMPPPNHPSSPGRQA